MILHYGYFEDVCAVIGMCPLCSVLHAACLSFEVDHLFSSQSAMGSKGYCLSLFLTSFFSHLENSCHALVRSLVLQQAI